MSTPTREDADDPVAWLWTWCTRAEDEPSMPHLDEPARRVRAVLARLSAALADGARLTQERDALRASLDTLQATWAKNAPAVAYKAERDRLVGVVAGLRRYAESALTCLKRTKKPKWVGIADAVSDLQAALADELAR